MKTLTIRNVPKRLAEALDRERKRKYASLNSTVLDLKKAGTPLPANDAPWSLVARG